MPVSAGCFVLMVLLSPLRPSLARPVGEGIVESRVTRHASRFRLPPQPFPQRLTGVTPLINVIRRFGRRPWHLTGVHLTGT